MATETLFVDGQIFVKWQQDCGNDAVRNKVFETRHFDPLLSAPASVTMKVRSLIDDVIIIATTRSGDCNANRYPEVQPAMAGSNTAFGSISTEFRLSGRV